MLDKARTALAIKYQDIFPDRETIWENVNAPVDSNAVFNEFSFVPAELSPTTLGIRGEDLQTGFLQIGLYKPLDIGLEAFFVDIEKIRKAFNPSFPLTYQGVCVNITSNSYKPFDSNNGKYFTIVTIYWEARVKRTNLIT